MGHASKPILAMARPLGWPTLCDALHELESSAGKTACFILHETVTGHARLLLINHRFVRGRLPLFGASTYGGPDRV